MKSKIISLILVAVSTIGLIVPPVAVSAIDDVCSSEAVDAVKAAAGCPDFSSNENAANNLFINIINWVMGIIAMVAVVAIIIGGVQYMTSTGDAGKVKKAKDTILYAVIGLIVVALSAVIVNFVIANLINPQSSSDPGSTISPSRPIRPEPTPD